ERCRENAENCGPTGHHDNSGGAEGKGLFLFYANGTPSPTVAGHSNGGAVDRLDRMTEAQLLALRFSDLPKLGVRLPGTGAEAAPERTAAELRARGLRFRPYFWLSDEWFTPDGAAGVAVPFYLAHPRLTALERRIMGRAEGESEVQCLRILRHELGHAVEN